MGERLLVVVIGHRNAGKSKTWNTMFERSVKTGKESRYLYLNKAQWIDDVFLVNGSPQERDVPVEEMMPEELPRIVLCSVQYREGAKDTFNFFFQHGYDVFVQWLNPGYSDQNNYPDDLDLVMWLLDRGAALCQRTGKDEPEARVNELKQYVLGWATFRDLVRTEF